MAHFTTAHWLTFAGIINYRLDDKVKARTVASALLQEGVLSERAHAILLVLDKRKLDTVPKSIFEHQNFKSICGQLLAADQNRIEELEVLFKQEMENRPLPDRVTPDSICLGQIKIGVKGSKSLMRNWSFADLLPKKSRENWSYK